MDIFKEYFTKYKWYAIAILILLLTILIVLTFFNKRNNEVLNLGTHGDNGIHKDLGSTCEIYVDVSGAVMSPNVYCFTKGSLYIDAIKKAGGFNQSKYAKEFVNSNINMAKVLEKNEKIYIPFKIESKVSLFKYVLVPNSEINSENKSTKSCVSINTGTLEDLDKLNGIGPSLAQKIIDARPFKSIEDVNLVSGIGDELFKTIKPLVCL